MADRYVVVQAAPVVDFVVPCQAEREPDGVRCTGEVRYAPGAVQAACTACGGWRGRYAPAEPGLLVLALPRVPEGAVALIGGTTGHRWSLALINGSRWSDDTTGQVRDYVEVLKREGSVTVEFGPPRPPHAPRTWPRLDDAPEDLKAVRGATGTVYRLSGLGWEADDDSATCDSLPSLQNYDGPLTEVLDA